MATVNFSLTGVVNAASNAATWGQMSAQTGPVNSHNFKAFVGADTQIDFAFKGGSIGFQVFSSTLANNWSVSIEGGPFIPLTNAADSTWRIVTPSNCTGLLDDGTTVHYGTLKSGSLTTGTNAIDTDAAFAVTSTGTPTMQAPTYAVGLTQYLPNGSSGIVNEGGWQIGAHGGYTTDYTAFTPAPASGVMLESPLTLKGSLSAIYLWNLVQGASFCLEMDGKDVGLLTQGSTGKYNLASFTNLDSAVDHTYRIRPCYSGSTVSAGLPAIIPQIGVVGTLNTTTPATAGTAFVSFSDSIGRGDTGTSNSALSHWHRLARDLGYSHISRDIYGCQVSGGAATSLVNRTSDVTNISGAAVVAIDAGSNDAANVVATGTFQTAYQTTLQAIVNGTGANCVILCKGIIPRNTVTVTAYNTAILAAIAAVASPKVRYIDPVGAAINTGTDLSDGTHPNLTGYAKLYNLCLPYIPNLTQQGVAPADILSTPANKLTTDSSGNVTPINVDGISHARAMRALQAFASGKSTVTDNGDGTFTTILYAQDGTTPAATIRSTALGARSTATIGA